MLSDRRLGNQSLVKTDPLPLGRRTPDAAPAASGSAEGEVVGLHAGADLQAQLPGLQCLAGEQRVERGDAAHLDRGEVTAVKGDVDRPAPTEDEVDVVGGEVQGQRGIGAGGRLLRTGRSTSR